ncbi:MAG: ATP-binding cassette domain-containing protein [Alphaproteobacteria bacterium]
MTNDFIFVENLSVIYPDKNQALKDVSFKLSGGGICALVGPNGAGKSTVFKSLMGFVKPTEGQIYIQGLQIKQALKSNKIAYVPQNEDVDWDFPILVEDVVMMGRYGHMGMMRHAKATDKQAVDDALKRMDIIALRKKQIGELSGGQKKRVFLARSIAQGGQIILLDEPFAGVDVKTENMIIDLMKELKDEGRLLLVSTHDLGSVPLYCDKSILINKVLVAQGDVDKVFTKENLEKAFGGVLRHLQLPSDSPDGYGKEVVILSDDEWPAVFLNEKNQDDSHD